MSQLKTKTRCSAAFFRRHVIVRWPFLLAALVAVVLLGWYWWARWGVQWFADIYINDGSSDFATRAAILGQAGDVFGGINALFAGFAFAGVVISLELTRRGHVSERQWANDEVIADQILSSYQWAYEALLDKREDVTLPVKDRLAWLTAARHLLRAEKLVERIQTDVFKLIQAEQQEFWRTKLYELVARSGMTYARLAQQMDGQLEPYIHLGSALVVEKFVDGVGWRDPIDEVDAHQYIERSPWGQNLLAREIEKYIVNVMPDFVDRHLEKYPDGRVATSRNSRIAMQRARQQKKQASESSSRQSRADDAESTAKISAEKLREIIGQKARTGAESTGLSDMFAIGCYLHLAGQREAGERLCKNVFDILGEEQHQSYFVSLLDHLLGSEQRFAQEVWPHAEVAGLFRA